MTTQELTERIAANMQAVEERIAAACRRVRRDPATVRLVVVTKGHPAATVQAAILAGARWLGENYAEEGVAKMSACSASPDLEWHMIGHVQSRKAALVCAHYHRMHSLDSLKLAQRLERFAAEYGRRLPVMLECNVSGEESKFGWPAWDEERWATLLEPFQQILALPHLEVQGLMTMAPFYDQPEPARPYFQRLKQLQEFLQRQLPGDTWRELSMGMSGDFEVAIEEGATIVRIGTAILGARP